MLQMQRLQKAVENKETKEKAAIRMVLISRDLSTGAQRLTLRKVGVLLKCGILFSSGWNEGQGDDGEWGGGV